jgi:hypothetical protein
MQADEIMSAGPNDPNDDEWGDRDDYIIDEDEDEDDGEDEEEPTESDESNGE